MKNVKSRFGAFITRFAAVAVVAGFVSRSAVANLPSGYTEVEYVTIPVSAEKVYGAYPWHNAVVCANVTWDEIRKIYVKYSSTDTAPANFMMVGGNVNDQCYASDVYLALSNSGGQDKGLSPYGMTSASVARTAGDDYARDGSVHELTFSCVTTAERNFMFGGCWQDHSWSVTGSWYRVTVYGVDDALLADFIPCVRDSDSVAGFWETESAAFYERHVVNAAVPLFVAGPAVTTYPVTVSYADEAFGTVSPSVGTADQTAHASLAFALTGGETDGGVTYYYNSDRSRRAKFRDCAVTVDGEETVTKTTPSFSVTIDGDATAVWSFSDYQQPVTAIAGTGGGVRAGDAAEGLTSTVWGDDQTQVSCSATPAAGYEFFCWSGDGVTDRNLTDNPISVAADTAKRLQANFIVSDPGHVATAVEWSSGPAAFGPGDSVTVPAGATVVLSNATPHLASFTVLGTVVVSNWLSRIDAAAITVGSGGTIMAGTDGYLLNGMTPNRVWLFGETLTVEAGGKVTADAAGYAGTNGPCWTASVSRQAVDSGNGRNISPYGGVYGGADSFRKAYYRDLNYFLDPPEPYGSAEWPYDVGSGSGAFIRKGGGAVVLDFSTTVTVNGTVSADAGTAKYKGFPSWEASAVTGDGHWNWMEAGFGSGGGVVIKCQTITGAGTVSANSGLTTSGRGGYGGGSGGRVAVHYDAAAQSNATCSIRFEARGGIASTDCHCQFPGEPGTLWFPDNRFIDTYAATGWTFAGTWLSAVGQPSGFATDGDLTIDGGQLRFAEPFDLSVGGNLTITGAKNYAEASGLILVSNSTVTVGGDFTLTVAKLAMLAGGSVDVGGDFTMTDDGTRVKGAMLYLTAAPTNGVDEAYGAKLDVGGLWTVGANAVVVPECHPTNGAIPSFTCSNFFMNASATVVASQRGYEKGPGYELSGNAYRGSGYGGLSGGTYRGSVTYGSLSEPLDPGSGDGKQGSSSCLVRGGGVFYLIVSDLGTINGTILADASDATLSNGGAVPFFAGATGGAIYLRVKHLVGADTAVMRAMGAGPSGTYNSSFLGSGGRVAIWTSIDDTNWKDLWTAATVAPVMYSGTPNQIPDNGTLYWGTLPSTQISVDGTPDRYGTVTPPYGLSDLAATGQNNTFDIVLTTFDDGKKAVDLGSGHRIFAAQCEIFKDGVSDKVSSQYPILWKTPSSYTAITAQWTFDNEQYSVIADAGEHGTVQFTGGTAGPTATNWCAAGSSVTVTATPAANCSFVNWTGDGITMSNGTDNPLTLTTTAAAMNLRANFIYSDPSHEAESVTTVNGRMPEVGPGDSVTVPSTVTNYIDFSTPRLAKLDVSGLLVVSNWYTRIDADEIVVREGGAIKAGTDGFVLSGELPNRLWLKGGTLTVEAGGRIDADAAGFAGTNGPSWTASVARNVLSSSRQISPWGGCYGGKEGYYRWHWDSWNCTWGKRAGYGDPPEPYGSAEWPYEAGSGGGAFVRSGGGAIYLDFTGNVAIDGTVSADASDSMYYGYPSYESTVRSYNSWDNVNSSYGSGGGIVIKCASVSGAGTVSASSRLIDVWLYGYGGGSGGRIAVHYDAAEQAEAVCTVRFRARGGVSRGQNARGAYYGDPGTLWFTDNQFLESYAETGWTFAGSWHSGAGAPTGYSHSGDLLVEDAQLRFPEPFDLSVSGELCVTGTLRFATASGLYFGTNATVSAASVKIADSKLALEGGGSLATSGDITLVDAVSNKWQTTAEVAFRGALLYLQAARTNGTDNAYGLTCTVGGKLHVGQDAVVLPYCHLDDGAIPAFFVRDLFIHTNGCIDASTKGYLFDGPTSGRASATGSSHGGRGYKQNASTCYDSETEPMMPGCGDCYGMRGGGVVFMDVSRKAVIDGQILADAKDTVMIPDIGGGWRAGASGGAVHLRLYRLTGGDSALVRAMGGGPGGYNLGDPGKGGGGRIAIWTCKNDSSWQGDTNRVTAAAYLLAGDYAELAENGPDDGTVYWGRLMPHGFVFMVR